MAGFETTSGAIQLIMLDLAKNPEVQTKLRDEILTADSSDVDIIESLPYLDAVTREGCAFLLVALARPAHTNFTVFASIQVRETHIVLPSTTTLFLSRTPSLSETAPP